MLGEALPPGEQLLKWHTNVSLPPAGAVAPRLGKLGLGKWKSIGMWCQQLHVGANVLDERGGAGVGGGHVQLVHLPYILFPWWWCGAQVCHVLQDSRHERASQASSRTRALLRGPRSMLQVKVCLSP